MSGLFGWDYPPGCDGVPDDYEKDWIHEAKKWIELNERKQPELEEEAYVFELIKCMYSILEEEGLT